MARYTGPSTRVSRRFGQYIVGSPKVLERRNFPPGQHGPKSRRKLSEYAVGLAEKQKLRFIYGLLERQFRRVFAIAKKERGVTGELNWARFPRLVASPPEAVLAAPLPDQREVENVQLQPIVRQGVRDTVRTLPDSAPTPRP